MLHVFSRENRLLPGAHFAKSTAEYIMSRVYPRGTRGSRHKLQSHLFRFSSETDPVHRI